MEHSVATQVQGLEKRVEWLTSVVIVLGIALGFVSGVIPIVIVGFLFLLPILVLTHKWLPGFARSRGKLLSTLTAH